MTNFEKLKDLDLTEEQFSAVFSMLIGSYVSCMRENKMQKPTIVHLMVETSMFLRDRFLAFPGDGIKEMVKTLSELDKIIKSNQN